MASTNTIGILISAKDEASKTLSQVSSEIKNTGKASEEADPKAGRFSSSLSSMGNIVKATAVAFATYKLGQMVSDFATSSVRASAELEQTNMAFQSLTGNVQVANSVFSQLVQYANVTPFESKDIEKAAQTLMSFGTAGQQTVDIIKQLGDVTSVGGGDLQALSLVTGQVFAQGKMRAQDMYQVINDGGAGLIKVMAENAGGMQKLTDEFNNGGIPAKQYFDAITTATQQGGFAFQGANKQADTFNGRLSTLKDAATQFGEKLIGVHIDPQLGLQVQPGGLFDRMKTMMSGVTDMLTNWGQSAGDILPKMMAWFSNLGSVISKNLGAAFSNLWGVLSQQVFPMLGRLWHEVIEPLIPVIGTVLLGAIKVVVVAFTDLLKIVTPVVNFLITNKDFLAPIIGGFIGLKAAMMLTQAFTALQAGFTVLTTATIPGAVASFGGLSALIASPIVMPAIAVGAALAAIASVWNAYNNMMSAIDQAKATQAQFNADSLKNSQHFLSILNDGVSSPRQKELAKQYLHNTGFPGYATGTNFAEGGLSIVGENGPELVNLPRGSQVKTNSETRKMLGGSSLQIGALHIHNQMDEQKFLANLGWRLALR